MFWNGPIFNIDSFISKDKNHRWVSAELPQNRVNVDLFLIPLQKIKTSESTYLCLAFSVTMPLPRHVSDVAKEQIYVNAISQ